jgi:hypothetical protein
MKTIITMMLCCIAVLGCASNDKAGKPTHQVQDRLDEQKKIITAWAADPVIIGALHAQNQKGPIPGMDNTKWKATPASDPAVQALQKNPAGIWLTQRLAQSNGVFVEAFVCGVKSEKAAFVQKTTSYLHAGTPKFEVPMTGKVWQGEASVDESTGVSEIQIGVPVVDGGQRIGVLVVGVSTEKLHGK